MEKYGTAGQVTYDIIIWRMCCACWITHTHTHSEYEILTVFPYTECLNVLCVCALPGLFLYLPTIYCYIITATDHEPTYD